MARTQSIICGECKVAHWVGQGTELPRLYNGAVHVACLNLFLLVHQGHILAYGDDESIMLLDHIERGLEVDDCTRFGDTLDRIDPELIKRIAAVYGLDADAIADALIH
jgi:hypothetical protein